MIEYWKEILITWGVIGYSFSCFLNYDWNRRDVLDDEFRNRHDDLTMALFVLPLLCLIFWPVMIAVEMGQRKGKKQKAERLEKERADKQGIPNKRDTARV